MGVTGANYQLISFPHISSQCRQFACNSVAGDRIVAQGELCSAEIKESLAEEQIVFSSSACPSDKQAWVATYDPFD